MDDETLELDPAVAKLSISQRGTIEKVVRDAIFNGLRQGSWKRANIPRTLGLIRSNLMAIPFLVPFLHDALIARLKKEVNSHKNEITRLLAVAVTRNDRIKELEDRLKTYEPISSTTGT